MTQPMNNMELLLNALKFMGFTELHPPRPSEEPAAFIAWAKVMCLATGEKWAITCRKRDEVILVREIGLNTERGARNPIRYDLGRQDDMDRFFEEKRSPRP